MINRATKHSVLRTRAELYFSPYRYVSASRISAGTPNCSWFAAQPHPPTTGRWSAAVRFAGAFTRLRGSVCEFSQTLLLTRVMPASSTNSVGQVEVRIFTE